MLKIVIRPVIVFMETETIFWELALICCHVLDNMHLSMNITDQIFLVHHGDHVVVQGTISG